MKKTEYLGKIMTMKIDDAKVKKIESVYGNNLPDLLKRIVSNNSEAEFFDDDTRVMSFDEILDAENDLHVAFHLKGMIPVMDCGENDFIVYHFSDNSWSKFNIVDETMFRKGSSIEELLK